MPTSFLEIVELPDGRMLGVGVQMAGRRAEGEPEKEDGPRVLH